MAAECDVLGEIEVLQSIYLDELHVTRTGDSCMAQHVNSWYQTQWKRGNYVAFRHRGWEVSLVLYPSTAEDSVSQFVRLTLTMTLDREYPFSPPNISIHNPRGLSDEKLNSVKRCLQTEAEASLGSPVLYQLIEKAKEMLTESNIPHGNCVICLYDFKEDEVFTKTSCYHYFHSHCLGRYVTHSERELRERERELEEDKTRERTEEEELTVVCPVCREPLMYDVEQLLSSPAPCFPEIQGVEIGADFRRKWRKLQGVLERQKAKGGLIDREVESNRFLIHINETPVDGENMNLDVDASTTQSVPYTYPVSPNEVRVQGEQLHSGQSYHRGWPGHRRFIHSKYTRRGRGRPQHGRPAPPSEQFVKLNLSSTSTNCQASESRLQKVGNAEKVGNVELNQTKMTEDGCSTVQNDKDLLVSDKQPICQPNLDGLKTDCPKDVGESVHSRTNRGRRRGPRGSGQQPSRWQERHVRGPDQWDAPGSAQHNWDGRAPRSRGGAYNPCNRGGGPRQGHGRGFHQKVVEREVGKEGVL